MDGPSLLGIFQFFFPFCFNKERLSTNVLEVNMMLQASYFHCFAFAAGRFSLSQEFEGRPDTVKAFKMGSTGRPLKKSTEVQALGLPSDLPVGRFEIRV